MATQTVKAIRISQTGGPEVMQWVDVEVGEPGPGEIRVRQHAVGLNFIDVYFRTGLYPMPLPAGLGLEAAGVVEAAGPGVDHLPPGTRVAYAGPPIGAYAQARVMPAAKVVALPDSISFEQAAAMMLQGLTAQYLLRSTYPVKAGDTILVHAAAGGVGSILVQWAKALGAMVIGTVGSDEKAALVKSLGCDHPIIYTRENFTERVREITSGKGVPVVYDSIGKDTFIGSLDCLAPLGTMVNFGNSSGALTAVSPGDLVSRGSLYFTRPTLNTYTERRSDLERMAGELFDIVASGKVKIGVHQHYPLAEAGRAHRDLEGRKTTGSSVLLP